MMPDERDHNFATDVLNASLTLISILVAVIIFLAAEYKGVETYAAASKPIRDAVIGTTVVSGYTGILALAALIHLRCGRVSADFLAWAFSVLIAAITLGILYLGFSLMA